ncbi:MAG: hypothetical protein ACP5C3_01715 [Methanomicrobiales archaeon]
MHNIKLISKKGDGWVTIHGGNPQNFAYVKLDTNSQNIKPENINPGDKFNVYGVYEGIQAHNNDGIDKKVPTLISGILENSQ